VPIRVRTTLEGGDAPGPVECTVTLAPLGGAGGTESVVATYGAALPAIVSPRRTGYAFDGYWTEAGESGRQYYTATGAGVRDWDRTEDTTLYAHWTATHNHAPVVAGHSPAEAFEAMEVGAGDDFSVTVSDPDDDILSVTWYVTDTTSSQKEQVGGGTAFAFVAEKAGRYVIRAEVADGVASAAWEWEVRVLPADVEAYGEIAGSGLVWFVADGTLTLSGNGALPPGAAADPPYRDYLGGIDEIIVENGVSDLAAGAFASFPNLEYLYLPASVMNSWPNLGLPETCHVIRTEVRGFVERLYRLCLDRASDKAGSNDWCLQLASGANDGANVAFGFFMSREMTNRRLSDRDYIEILYNVMMGRHSDGGGMLYWLEALGGGVSRTGVLRGFAESTEFTRICEAYGINRGSVNPAYLENRDHNYGITKFVARCYTKALGRAYDADGLNYWCGVINSSPTPKATAVYVSTTGFFDSQEFQNRRLGNGAFVDVLYETFLGRAADAGGRADWVSQLNAGADRHNVMAGFYNSAEFNNIMAGYGIR
jgi:hypothetical protein